MTSDLRRLVGIANGLDLCLGIDSADGNGFDLGSSSIANPFIKNDSIFNLYPPSKKPNPMRRNMPRYYFLH